MFYERKYLIDALSMALKGSPLWMFTRHAEWLEQK